MTITRGEDYNKDEFWKYVLLGISKTVIILFQDIEESIRYRKYHFATFVWLWIFVSYFEGEHKFRVLEIDPKEKYIVQYITNIQVWVIILFIIQIKWEDTGISVTLCL